MGSLSFGSNGLSSLAFLLYLIYILGNYSSYTSLSLLLHIRPLYYLLQGSLLSNLGLAKGERVLALKLGEFVGCGSTGHTADTLVVGFLYFCNVSILPRRKEGREGGMRSEEIKKSYGVKGANLVLVSILLGLEVIHGSLEDRLGLADEVLSLLLIHQLQLGLGLGLLCGTLVSLGLNGCVGGGPQVFLGLS